MPIQAVDYIDTQRYPFEQAGEAGDALIAGLRAELEASDRRNGAMVGSAANSGGPA